MNRPMVCTTPCLLWILVLLVAGEKMLAVRAGTSIDQVCLPCQPTCLACLCPLIVFLLKAIFSYAFCNLLLLVIYGNSLLECGTSSYKRKVENYIYCFFLSEKKNVFKHWHQSGNGNDDLVHGQEVRRAGVGETLRRLPEASPLRGQCVSAADASQALWRTPGLKSNFLAS